LAEHYQNLKAEKLIRRHRITARQGTKRFPSARALAQRRKPRRQRQPALILDQGLPGFPRHTQSLDASRRKAGSHYRARPALDPDIIAQEIVEDLQAALAQFAEIATDLKR
jgi:hypothetical protein